MNDMSKTPTKGVPLLMWPDATKDVPRADSQSNIIHFLEWRGVELWLDLFSRKNFASIDGWTVEIGDDLLRKLRLEADGLGLKTKKDFFTDVILEIASQHGVHPLLDYLDDVESKWDRQLRLDDWLTTYLGVEPSKLATAFGRKHLVAAVRRARHPGFKHDAMLVLEGPQGAGKSQVVAILGGQWSSDALTIAETAKEVLELTTGVWLVEVAELSGLRKGQIDSVKAMITRPTDRARPAYGRFVTERPRSFVMFGTVNEGNYLIDTTGNRRFWPVRVGKIDLDALKRDRDQLWAEAAHFERLGERTDLPPALYSAATEEQAKRQVTDLWFERLEARLAGLHGTILKEAILACLEIKPDRQDGQVGRRVHDIMTRLGWTDGKRRFPGGTNAQPCYTTQPKGEPTIWVSPAD